MDVPSGLDLQTGTLHAPFVHADVTLTLAAPKHGLRDAEVAVGRLLLADIGIPLPLYEQAGIEPRRNRWTAPIIEIGL